VSLFRSLVLIILRLSYAMIRRVALLLLGNALASCGTYQANVGKVVDMIPEWSGGLPKGVPPRPGTPEYEAHRKGIDERGTGGAQPQGAKKSDAGQ
jgi:hypothetical protein